MLDSCHLTFCSIVSNFVCTSLRYTSCLKEVPFQNAYEKSEWVITLKIVDKRGPDLNVVLIMRLCILESKQMLISFAILSQTVSKLGIQNLGSYMSLTCEYELDILSNNKVSLATIHCKNYVNFRLLLACHLFCNHLLLFLRTLK